MAMKNAAKKSRRRLKRSVRRSLAAVLMITAIGVADSGSGELCGAGRRSRDTGSDGQLLLSGQ